MEDKFKGIEELARRKVWELALGGHKGARHLIEQYQIKRPKIN